jgi:predicted phosphodiesterase
LNRDENILWYDFSSSPEIVVIPLADVHLGAQESAIGAFTKLVNEIAKEPNVYVTLQGDLIDNGTRNSVTNVFKSTIPPSQQKREMAATLEPIRDKILCIMCGNHERRSGKEADDDPTYDIAVKLDIEDRYRESLAFVRIAVGAQKGKQLRSNGGGKPYVYYVACTHGAGGGSLPGAAINRADSYLQSMDGVDVFIHAHSHRQYALRGSKMVVDYANKLVRQRPTLVMCAGSWLGYADYAVEKNLRPVTMPGANKLILHGDKYLFESVI